MMQDVGGRYMEWMPVKSGSPWRYVDVDGYCSGGLRFRHIQSPDYSGLFAFLGYRKTPPGSTLGKWCRGAMRLASVPLDPSWGIRRKMMSQSFTTRVDELWCQGVVQDSRPLEGHPWETLCK
ncbi:TPA: DUF4113 domain-containing protein [Pseudomonas putida]